MKPELQIGASATLERMVACADAIHLGQGRSSSAIVFSTPSMIALMEYTAREVLRPFLDEGEESVGVNVHVEHLAATPLQAPVRGHARVIAVEGRFVEFEITASDERDVIGRGTHRRAVITIARFADKLKEKVQAMTQGAVLPSYQTPNSGELSKLATLEAVRDGALVTVTLNRPAKLNAVNVQMTADLESLNAWLAGHPEIRVVILTGAGDAFCAGDDVKEVGTLDLATATNLSHRQAELYLTWERLPQIFIAAVNGAAFGGGCVCAYSCDFRVAAHSARFGMPEILLGWPPGYGIAQLTSLVGKSRALELCLLGESISSQLALTYGLVHEVVPQNRLHSTARALAGKLLAQPAEALRQTKRLIYLDEGLQPKVAHLADTAAYIQCLEQPDAREGIAAFSQKRRPKFNQ
ncbi:thioesterase, FlK family [Schlesneria paludicola]|uniref:thioesterase, FlK family n=1 Tax=Schlesneria paludicola TaxID=360056 RepID=UPI00029B2EB5|nr:enoyl-CoA hydratase-related protein [Schlesneria paludicola]